MRPETLCGHAKTGQAPLPIHFAVPAPKLAVPNPEHQGTTLGYRTLYVWFEKENLMITVQTNSQPDDDANKLSDAATAIYEIVRSEAK